MIDYKQLESASPGELPPDVDLITDDANAEMAAIEEMTKECGFEIDLPKERSDDGKFHINIPGAMVGEFSECSYDFDNGLLEQKIEVWNEEILSETEGE